MIFLTKLEIKLSVDMKILNSMNLKLSVFCYGLDDNRDFQKRQLIRANQMYFEMCLFFNQEA